jgi:hypothetical protein
VKRIHGDPEAAPRGSVWLTTDEAETYPVVKEKFLKGYLDY